MINKQEEDKILIPFRSGRFFNKDEKWYFASREGENKGPFTSKTEAEKALQQFILDCQKYKTISPDER